MANALSHRNSRTKILPPERIRMTNQKCGEHVPQIIYTGDIAGVGIPRLHTTYPVIDPYLENENLNLRHISNLSCFVRHDFQEVSNLEAIYVDAVLK